MHNILIKMVIIIRIDLINIYDRFMIWHDDNDDDINNNDDGDDDDDDNNNDDDDLW